MPAPSTPSKNVGHSQDLSNLNNHARLTPDENSNAKIMNEIEVIERQ